MDRTTPNHCASITLENFSCPTLFLSAIFLNPLVRLRFFQWRIKNGKRESMDSQPVRQKHDTLVLQDYHC